MLVVAGETIVDMIEFEPRRFEAFNGGGPYNVAKAAAKMGTDTGYLSPLSDDVFGDGFFEEMKALGISALSPRSRQPSGLAIVKKNENGHPSYSFIRDASADRDISLDALQASMPTNAKVFYVGGLALADGNDAKTWSEFVQTLNLPLFVDPNVRPTFIKDKDAYLKRLEQVYNATDIVKLSDEDIAWLAPDVEPMDYMKSIMKAHNIGTGLLTEGANGAHWVTHSGHGFANSPKIQVMDTVGAGDCFSGAMISFLMRENALSLGFDHSQSDVLQNALEYAVTAAAINCTRSGANAPTHQEVLAFNG